MFTRSIDGKITFTRALGLAACLSAAASATPVCEGDAVSGVLQGSFAGSGEWTVPVVWGDGINDLRQIWSVGNGDESGYAYGTNVPESNVDVYNAGVIDPLTVADASAFVYTSTNVEFIEGETVFFRGSNGRYGAWIIDDMYFNPNPGAATLLDARWFFVADGGSDFTVTAGPIAGAVAEPGTMALVGLGLGLAGMAGYRRRRPVPHAQGNRTGFGTSGS